MVVATSATDLGPLQSAIRGEIRQFDPQIAVDFELLTDWWRDASAGSSSG